jgi:hypothetical protein
MHEGIGNDFLDCARTNVFWDFASGPRGRPLSKFKSKLLFITLVTLSLATIQVARAQLQLGSLLLVDPAGGTGAHGSLLVVDQTTGDRSVFSDFGAPAQGPLGVSPCGISVLPGLLGLGDTLFVLDSKAGTNNRGELFRVDQGTGIRQIFTDFGNGAQGPLGQSPVSLATTNGLLGIGATILVLDSEAGTNGRGALFSVDEVTQNRQIINDLGVSSQGPLGVQCSAVITAPGLLGLGTAETLIVDEKGGTNQRGAILLVNIVTGQRTLLSDFGNSKQGPLGAHPVAAAVSPAILDLTNTVLVLDSQAGTNGRGALFVLNSSGFRILLSDFGDYTSGPLGGQAQQVAVVNGTEIVLTDNAAGLFSKGALFSVDPSSGFRSLLADFAEVLEGPTLSQSPIGIGWW